MRQRVAEAFHPGEFIREEMEARGWSQTDLAEILGRPSRLVSELLSGGRSVTLETAQGLGEAFGTDPQFWMNLQSSYDLWRLNRDDQSVARRARLYSFAPIRDMLKRGWIEESENIDVLESRVCAFYSIKSLDEEPKLGYAAKTSMQEQTPAQRAWLFRAKQLAKSASAVRFTPEKLEDCVSSLRVLMHTPEETRHVPRLLADAGIRFVVVEQLHKTKIDGACFWLDHDSPVVILSLRYDRIDSFWHNLGHELGHIAKKHVSSLDIELDKNVQDDQNEVAANTFAQEMLIPQDEMDSFIARVRPLYSHTRIVGFANRLGVHPGIVVGQLQFRGEVSFAHSRKMLVPIRQFVVPSTLTDGWGAMLPASL